MPMEWVQKALDTVVGANLLRQDLSNAVSVADGRPRPFLENAPQVAATNVTHEWNEQSLIAPGNGVSSYSDGATPTADAQASVQKSNLCCRIGKTAQVTDDMVAAFSRGGTTVLADGEMEKQVQQAIDYQTELKTREVLDEMEWMHISGDKTVTGNPWYGGQTDGLEKFILAGGKVVNGGGTSTVPVAITETLIRDVFRGIAELFPAFMPDTCLIPPELKPDFNTFVGSGAGNPIVRVISNDTATQNLIAGSPEVTKYDTGFGVVDVRLEPNLSPLFNPLKTGQVYQNVLFYNSKQVKNASLRPLGAEQLARINTSVQRMITTTFCQEQRIAKHTGALQYMKSSIT